MIQKVFRELKKKLSKPKSQNPDDILEIFKNALRQEIDENVIGIYIVGSYALGDFNDNLSDIDFVVILRRQLSTTEMKALAMVHSTIEKRTLQPNLNGIYILESDIGKERTAIEMITFFHEGSLKRVSNPNAFYEINPITWAELKLYGITLYGPDCKDLSIKVDWHAIHQYLYQNINTYWVSWLKGSKNPLHPYFYITLFRRSENAWCVSGVARQLFTLRENSVSSKRKACQYLLEDAPEKFKPILKDTIAFRTGKSSRNSWLQKREMQDFLEFCIDSFNKEFTEKYASLP